METGNYSINFRPLTNKNIKAERKIAIFHSSTEEIVEYPNVFGEGTALQYKALINGIKENIIFVRIIQSLVIIFHGINQK